MLRAGGAGGEMITEVSWARSGAQELVGDQEMVTPDMSPDDHLLPPLHNTRLNLRICYCILYTDDQ